MKIPILKSKYSTQINMVGDLKNQINDFRKKLKNVIEEEKEPHITILYGINKLADKKYIKRCNLSGKLGLIKKFKQDDKDVIYIEVISDDVVNKNKQIKDCVSYSSDYNKYTPHLTLAYVEKDTNDELINDKTFLGKEFVNLPLLFSYKNHKKELIK